MKVTPSQIFVFLCLAPWAQAAITVSDASAFWSPLPGNYDYLSDQQTGQTQGDIVGSATDPGFFIAFNNNGAASSTDGTLGFRVRFDNFGGNTNNPSFDRVAWVGIDANIDGSIDAFVGLNRQGNNSEIGIYLPGNDLNTSPSTTSIASTPYVTYALTSQNYNYRAVDYVTDGGTINDLTPSSSGDPDYYASFMIPFADLVTFLGTKSIAVNDTTPLRYIVATSTQTNSLNQDLGGVNGSINSSTSWQDLNAFTPSGAVPEPSSALSALSSLAAFLLLRRRR